MKKPAAILSVILSACLCMPGFALAQDRRGGGEDRRGNEDRPRGEAGPRNGMPGRQMPPQWRGDQRADQRGYQGGERGAGPDHSFRRGDRLPREFQQNRYVVNDWRGHQLSQPPRGYHWVQTGGDYVLVAIATGVILQLLLSN
jgi:Ni/Co efflux regulator RcnB